jgi:DNA (cytosine-5)-methyltransferase 1
MTAPKVGALFAGYGGLELAVREVFPAASPAWLAEFDAAPSRILEQRFPGVPNLGDVTAVEWSAVEPVDVITGGSPCQDLSHAGKRAGMRAGTRSGLWASMCDAIEIIRPRLVVWENVRGALSAEADSAVEPCPICVGDGGRVSLRALGRVLGDLAELGYDAAWCGLRAADVGAPHGRFRVFVLAWDATGAPGLDRGPAVPDADRRSTSGYGPALRDITALLPTPAVNDMGAGKTVEDWDAWTARMKAEHGNGNGHGKSLAIEALRGDFGPYAPAIARWEAVIGRPAPAPTEPTGKGGAHRLSPRFVEWLMGLPDGWVADTDTTRNEQLKALGNGVVPQQAAAAIRHLIGVRAAALGEVAA